MLLRLIMYSIISLILFSSFSFYPYTPLALRSSSKYTPCSIEVSVVHCVYYLIFNIYELWLKNNIKINNIIERFQKNNTRKKINRYLYKYQYILILVCIYIVSITSEHSLWIYRVIWHTFRLYFTISTTQMLESNV